MPAPYSNDLRQRVLDAYLSQNRSAAEIAEQFSVGESSLNRWLALFRSTGSVAPKPAAGGQPSKLEGDTLDAVHILVLEKPDIIEREITSALDAIHRVRVSRSAVNRALKRLNLSRKKRPSSRRNERASESPRSVASSRKGSRSST